MVYTVVSLQQQEKMELYLLQTIPENECEIVNYSTHLSTIYWHKMNEVFILNGVMYDIAKIKTIGGVKYFYCITEQSEIRMLNDISLKFTDDGENGKDLKLAFSEVYLPNGEFNSSIKFNNIISYPTITPSFSAAHLDIILPPPKHWCAIA